MDRRAALRRAGGIALLGSLTGCAGLFANDPDGSTTDGNDASTAAGEDTTATADHDPPVDDESDDEPDQFGPDRFPTYWIGAVEGVQSDSNELEARVSLNGADRVTIEHDGVEIGTFTDNDHRTFHERSAEPYVRTGEEVEIYGHWDGERRLLGTRVVEHGFEDR